MLGSYSTTICKLLLALTILVFASACEYHVLKQDPQAKSAKKLSADQVVDAQIVQGFVLSSCVRCHGGTTQPILNSLDAIKMNIAKIQNSVNANKMPPSRAGYTPLTDCEKAILHVWVSEGMPTSSTTKVSTLPSCDSYEPIVKPPPVRPTKPPPVAILDMPLNYQTLNTQILQKKCAHCHNPDGPDIMAAMYLFYPYSEITSHGRLLGTNRNDSNFVKMLEADDSERMPPADDSPRLSPEEIEFVKRWIDAGHPEN